MSENKTKSHRRTGSRDVSPNTKPTHRRLGSGDPLRALFGGGGGDGAGGPNTKPTHRRLGSKVPPSVFGDDGAGGGGGGEPLTTSKAVMLSVIAPCMYHTESEPTVKVVKDDQKNKKVDDDVTAEEEDDDSSEEDEELEKSTTNETTNYRGPAEGLSEDSAAVRSVLEPSEDAIPMREWLNIANTESQEITMEEASAVKRRENEPNKADINIEELLRIAFQALLDERYLLNVPTFSQVEDKKDIHVPLLGSMSNLPDDVNGKPKPWIRVEAMALPNALGFILEKLERIGVGTIVGTVSVYKLELCRTASPYSVQPAATRESTATKETTAAATTTTTTVTKSARSTADANSHRGFEASMRQGEQELAAMEDSEKVQIKSEKLIEEARAEWKNAATRLRIEQIREQIAESAALSFDFLSLLTIAGILAGIGLVTNNSVVIVASMLVSPIMGPVLGLTFGTQVKDWPLVVGSFINETVALTVCLFIGMVIGLCAGFTTGAKEDWPTPEMASRGDPSGLLAGVAVAIPSGAGVCLSVVGGNTSSLVGVAISASLLPPVVNTGICFMYAILLAAGAVDRSDTAEFGTAAESADTAAHFAEIGAISFALTIINIVCIWMAGIAMFHIKEVSPAENKGAFWARDLRVARELNEQGKRNEKPPPLDISVLMDGVMSAWTKKRAKDSSKAPKTVKIIPPRPHNVRTYSNTYAAQPTNLNRAFAYKPRRKSRYTTTTSSSSQEALWWRDLVDHTTGEEEDAHYVNLDELADLLGLGDYSEDDEDDVIAPIYWTRTGGGRYI